MKKNFFYYASISILAGLCLCMGWYHHYIRHMSSVAPMAIPAFEPEQKTVEVYAKVLSSDESVHLLGRDLPDAGIQPLHITIDNNSPTEYTICPECIDLNYLDAKEVAKKMQISSLPRSIAFKVLGFFFWPFMIPGTLDSIHTFHSYKMLKNDYAAKSIKDELVPMYSTVNRIIFVPKEEYKETFTLTLTDPKSHKMQVFEISHDEMES
jgi:hypothetical protein